MSIFRKIAQDPDEGPGKTKDCPACNGSGDCSRCGGDGATGPRSDIPCPVCSIGKIGECQPCSGTGKVHI